MKNRIVLDLLQKTCNEEQLHELACPTTGFGYVYSGVGIGSVVDRFFKGQYSKDTQIGKALQVTQIEKKTRQLQVKDISHLYTLAQLYKSGDSSRKIPKNPDGYAICLALIVRHQQLTQVDGQNLQFINELQAHFAKDGDMNRIISQKQQQMAMIGQQQKQPVSKLLETARVEKQSDEKKQAEPRETGKPAPLDLALREDVPGVLDSPLPTEELPDLESPSSRYFPSARWVDSDSSPRNLDVPHSQRLRETYVTPEGLFDSPTVSPVARTTTLPQSSLLLDPKPSLFNDTMEHSPSAPSATISAPKPATATTTTTTTTTNTTTTKVKTTGGSSTKLPESKKEPNLLKIYEEDKKKRHTNLLIALAVLLSPTLIVPAVCYGYWYNRKRKEVVEKIEMHEQEMNDLGAYAAAVQPPAIQNQEQIIKMQMILPQSPEKKTTYYADKAMGWRLHYLNERRKKEYSWKERGLYFLGKKPLPAKTDFKKFAEKSQESKDFAASKEKSVQLAAQIRSRR